MGTDIVRNEITSEPLVSPYKRSQREALLVFRGAHYGTNTYRTNSAYVDWAFSDAYQCRNDRAALYVCEQGGCIVGAQSAIHFQLKAGDENVRSAWITDFAVLKQLQRTRGIGTAIFQVSLEANPVRFAMNVTPAAVAFALKQGYKHICEVPLWARPLDVGRTLKSRMRSMARFPIKLPAQALLDVILAVGLRTAARAQIQLVPAETFDERSNAIWSRCAASHRATCVRDREFLQWRFDRFPRPNQYERYWLYQKESAVGYIVLRFSHHNGLPSAFVVDYLCQPELLGNMLALTLNVCRQRGAAIAYCAALQPTTAGFRRLGFFKRKSGWQFMAYTGKCSTEIARIISEQCNWFVTMADSNVDHESAMAQVESSVSVS
jgi:hypothetical protein